MFNNLLESKPKKEKRGGGTVTSVVVHSILVGLAVYATANAAIRNEKPKQEKIDFVETPKDQPPPKGSRLRRRHPTWSSPRRRPRASRSSLRRSRSRT